MKTSFFFVYHSLIFLFCIFETLLLKLERITITKNGISEFSLKCETGDIPIGSTTTVV